MSAAICVASPQGRLGHANPELTLRVYAHALREEETDLSFLDFGSTKRHPRGTEHLEVAENQNAPDLSGRGHSVLLEHETRFEFIDCIAIDTASLRANSSNALHLLPRRLWLLRITRSSLAIRPHVGNVLRSLNSLMFTGFYVRRGA